MQDKTAARAAASRRAEIESRFVAASERASTPAPDSKAGAESDCIDHVEFGALTTFVVAPTIVPVFSVVVGMLDALGPVVGQLLFGEDSADASTSIASTVNVWALGAGAGGLVAAGGIVVMSTAGWRLRQIRRHRRAVAGERSQVRDAFTVAARTGTVEAKALLSNVFSAAEQVSAHADLLAGRADIRIDAAAEAASVARRVYEVESLRIEYGTRPTTGLARDRWDHAATALDEVLHGMTQRVESLSRYTRHLDRLVAVNAQMTAAQSITSLDDRLGVIVAESAIDDFVAADIGRLTDEISDLTAGMEAIVAYLGDDNQGSRPALPATESHDQHRNEVRHVRLEESSRR